MTITIPRKCHPILRPMWEAVNQRGISHSEFARRAGVSSHAIRNWREGTSPTLANLEACLNTVGLKLVIVPTVEPRFK